MRTIRTIRTIAAGALALSLVGIAPAAQADTVENTVNNGNLTAREVPVGSSVSIDYWLKQVKDAGELRQGDCNASADAPVTIGITPGPGVTADRASVSFTACGNSNVNTVRVTFAVTSAGSHVVTHTDPTGGSGRTLTDNVDFTLVGAAPAPPPEEPVDTPPVVGVTGVVDGAIYEIGAVPSPACSVEDAEDLGEAAEPEVSGTLEHGLGQQTATCSYTDTAGQTGASSATWSVVDSGAPSIEAAVDPDGPDGLAGWYVTAPTVSFVCDDLGSGIATCTGDRTLLEGGDQRVTGSAVDWAGNEATTEVAGLHVDLTDPALSVSGGPAPGASYYVGEVPAAPTCEASDDTSGPAGCKVAGGGTGLGSHTYEMTASDIAGRTTTRTVGYTVIPWRTGGFYSPVDLSGVLNTVKAGSTVPLKFEVFASAELTSTSVVSAFAVTRIGCVSGTPEDAVEAVTTGGTSLRYDVTGGQFVQNWQTPRTPGSCYSASIRLADGAGAITALFKVK